MVPEKDEDGSVTFNIKELGQRAPIFSEMKEAEVRYYQEIEGLFKGLTEEEKKDLGSLPEEEAKRLENEIKRIKEEVQYKECRGCGMTHRVKHLINMLCSNCQWECPQCEEITVKPSGNDYICESCRYGNS